MMGIPTLEQMENDLMVETSLGQALERRFKREQRIMS